MAKQEPIQLDGTVIEALGNERFRVELENGHVVLAHISGRMRQHYIKILVVDCVQLDMRIYDFTLVRITYRYKFL